MPMLSNFFRRSTDHKQRVNKEQNVQTDRAASRGSQGKYMKYVSFTAHPLEAVFSVFNVSLC